MNNKAILGKFLFKIFLILDEKKVKFPLYPKNMPLGVLIRNDLHVQKLNKKQDQNIWKHDVP